MSFRSFGVRIGIRVNRPELLPLLDRVLPPGAEREEPQVVDVLYSLFGGNPAPRQGIRPFHVAYADGGRIARTHDLEEAVHALEAHVRLVVASACPDRIFVHAGVVAKGGRAVVIPGRSFTGKSRLVEALVRAGADYYSDEYAVIDPTGLVHPFAKPLSLRAEGEVAGRPVAVEVIGGRSGVEPVPVGLVLVTKFRAGGRFRPRPLTAGQAVLSLFDNTVPARAAAQRALTSLRAAVLPAQAVTSVRGEAEETARKILERLET